MVTDGGLAVGAVVSMGVDTGAGVGGKLRLLSFRADNSIVSNSSGRGGRNSGVFTMHIDRGCMLTREGASDQW